MTLELDPSRRQDIKDRLATFFAAEFDENLSDFRADSLLDKMLELVGPAVYNQAVQDVRAHLQVKLDDLDGEVYLEC